MMHYIISCGSAGFRYRIIDDNGVLYDESGWWYESSRACEAAASFVLRSKAWDEANPDKQPVIADNDIPGRGGVPILQEKSRHKLGWLGNREDRDHAAS